MAQFLPYILPLMLGRTFDLHKMTVGVDIFSKETIDRREIYEAPYTELYSGIVKNADEARKLVLGYGINALSLKVKAGIVKAGVSGEYVSEPVNRKNVAERLIKSTHVTVTEYLPFDAKPIPNWKQYGEALGTHYVKSISYGGETIISIRLDTNNTNIKETIEKPISHMTTTDLGANEENEFIRNILKSVESTEIKIFTAVPFTKFPKDVGSLRNLSQFVEEKSVPIKVHLAPLKQLDQTREDKLENSYLDLDWFEHRFDDMLQTKTAISDWMNSLVKPLTEEKEQKVGEFYNSLENTLKVFYEVIGTLDASQGPDQLQKAYNALDAAVESKYGRYFYIKYLRFREEMDKDEGEESKKMT